MSVKHEVSSFVLCLFTGALCSLAHSTQPTGIELLAAVARRYAFSPSCRDFTLLADAATIRSAISLTGQNARTPPSEMGRGRGANVMYTYWRSIIRRINDCVLMVLHLRILN